MKETDDMNTPLRALLPCERFYIRVGSDTLKHLEQRIRRKHDGMMPFIAVKCDDQRSIKMLDVGWSFINKLDRAARGDPEMQREFNFPLDFAIWGRIERKRTNTLARIIRKHGMYREPELLEKLQKSGTVL